MGKSMVVKSAVKGALKGMRISGDFWKAMDACVAYKLDKATKRAKANGRKTIRPEDL